MNYSKTLVFGTWFFLAAYAYGTENHSPEDIVFEDHIAPILRIYCWNCHGAGNLAGQLDLRSQPLTLHGGENGPAIVPGNAEESLLYQKVFAGEMPPAKALEDNVVYSPVRPTAEHTTLLKRWIDGGAQARYTERGLNEDEDPPLTAADRLWWAFRSPVPSSIPQVQSADRVRTPIDAFLLRKLETEGMTFSPDGECGTLLRRLYLDLTGLPPTAEAIDEFGSDHDLSSWQRQIDLLLGSPAFGERWGRHWLDVAGYVDVVGKDNDANIINLSPGRWRYRDYVIDAFNSGMPFDRFITEQLAGDELVDWRNANEFTEEIRRSLTATGFLRQAVDSSNSKELNTADVRTLVLLDTVQIVSTGLLGLTLHCAQCHTHKFDPIRQADYYRFAAIFAPALNVQKWKSPESRFLCDVAQSEKDSIDSHNGQIDAKAAVHKQNISSLRKPFHERILATQFENIPAPLRDEVLRAVGTNPDKRTANQTDLVTRYGNFAKVAAHDVDAVLDDATHAKLAILHDEIHGLLAGKRSYGKIQAIWEFADPPQMYLFRRGDYEKPGPPVQPAVLAVADRGPMDFQILKPTPDKATSGYRLALARWMTRPEHPLLGRVFVNRVWQHYFGRGIVETPDNFGTSGEEPTHPELLDWLACEFVLSGFNVKYLHRLIVSSTAYRQRSSSAAADSESTNPQRVDPDNRLLWRMPLRRLESEIIRDRVLAASGLLNRKRGGPPVPLKPKPDGSVEIDHEELSDKSDAFRRSIYITARRNYHLTQLNVFDQPLLSHNCTRRTSSAVVLQSLNMLNGRFLLEHAGFLANRVLAEQTDPAHLTDIVNTAFRFTLAREPLDFEIRLCVAFLTNQTERHTAQEGLTRNSPARAAAKHLCHMLMNTNEFLYIP